jgi:hypothetical protein
MAAVLIGVLAGAGVLAVLAWPVTVLIFRRRPRKHRPQSAEHRRSNVQGGSHVGGGRSLGPRRDAEVIPDENPDASTVAAPERGNSPMDL